MIKGNLILAAVCILAAAAMYATNNFKLEGSFTFETLALAGALVVWSGLLLLKRHLTQAKNKALS